MMLAPLATHAYEQLRKRNYVGAEIIAQQAWNKYKSSNSLANPDILSMMVLNILRYCLIKQNKTAELQELGREVLAIPMFKALGHDIFARYYHSIGQNDLALKHAEILKQRLGPERANYYAPLFVNIKLATGDYENAVQEFKEWCKPHSLEACLRESSVDETFDIALPIIISLLVNCPAELKENAAEGIGLLEGVVDSFVKGIIEAATQASDAPAIDLSNKGLEIRKANPDAALLEKLSDCAFQARQLHAMLEACEIYNPILKKGIKETHRTENGYFFNKLGKQDVINREIAVANHFTHVFYRTMGELDEIIFGMPLYNSVTVSADNDKIISVSNAGTLLEKILDSLMKTSKFVIEEPVCKLDEIGSCEMQFIEVRPGSPADAIDDILRKTTRALAYIHASGPVELAKPALNAVQHSNHLGRRMVEAENGFSAEDISAVIGAMAPIGKKLETAFKTFVKDGNPRNFGLLFDQTGAILKKSEKGWHGFHNYYVVVFDFETALITTPHYDLLKLLEHDSYLPREKVDAITKAYIADYNDSMDISARLFGIKRRKITDPEAFELDRENWRIVQHISSYHHPNYSDPKYWKNKAFWMERGAETVDVLLTKYSGKYSREELDAISQLKPVFEKYRRMAEARVKK
jgi:hypothetical protein